jgi:hypothetical protein
LGGAEPSLLSGSDIHPPLLRGTFEHLAWIHFGTSSIPGERLSAPIHLRRGERVNSNLFAWPSLVHVTGAKIIGINDGNGADVLEVGPASPSSGHHRKSGAASEISVTPAASFPVVLGRVLTLCALIALVLQFGLIALRRKHSI